MNGQTYVFDTVLTNDSKDVDITLTPTKKTIYGFIIAQTNERNVLDGDSVERKHCNVVDVYYYDEDEYIDVFTNQGTAKRIKLKDLNTLSRAKSSTTLIKKVKTTNYELLSAFITNSKDTIGIKCNNDIITLKNSEIPINDLASTGSVITKQKLTKAFISKELKLIEDKDIELPKLKEESTKELTIDDFIDDFKL